jgi:Predicted membrane protein
MLAALVALAGVFVALYLTLYKLGYIGTLVCSVGSCETVQTSKWATFLGFPVGAWGVGYYIAVFVISTAGLSAALSENSTVSRVLVGMTGFGMLFSIWLTYLELFVIHAICQWCVLSAILATSLFVISVLDLREVTSFGDVIGAELRGASYGGEIRNTAEVSLRATTPEE